MPTILFTSIGRRVQLVRHFVEKGWDVIGADVNPDECAARLFVREVYRVPPSSHPDYYDEIGELCRREQVSCLVPLYEPELIGMAKRRSSFLEHGTHILVSDEEALKRCLDKFELAVLFNERGVPTPETGIGTSHIDDRSRWVVKPRTGMGSRDVYIVEAHEVEAYCRKVKEPIVQRFIAGQEYSIDAFVANDGRVLSVVPRMRLDVRAGEVAKSVTTADSQLTQLTLELLGHVGLVGPLTIQGIKEAVTGKFYFTEINPRFGGGVPLTIQAGIPYADFIAGNHSDFEGLHPYESGLKMLRYDEAVFVSEGEVR